MPVETEESRVYRGKARSRSEGGWSEPAGPRIAAVAERQHGIVAANQLHAIGIGQDAIDHGVRTGRLHRVHRGVFAVGHPRLTPEGRWLSAVLVCGPGAAVSHRSAGSRWGLPVAEGARVDVTVPPRGRRSRTGISVHASDLQSADRAVRDRIPVTSVPRTLLDLSPLLRRKQLEAAFNDADRRGLIDDTALAHLLERSAGRRGVASLRQLCERHRSHLVQLTRSQLEAEFVQLCREAGLPPPAVNVPVAGFEVDFLWPRQRVVVELDGFAFHGTREAFERDRARDVVLQTSGHSVLRFTHRQVAADRRKVASSLRHLLGVRSD